MICSVQRRKAKNHIFSSGTSPYSQDMVYSGFTSDWLRKWRKLFKPITKRSKQFSDHDFQHSSENRFNCYTIIMIFFFLIESLAKFSNIIISGSSPGLATALTKFLMNGLLSFAKTTEQTEGATPLCLANKYILLTTREGRTGRISSRGLHSMDRAQ